MWLLLSDASACLSGDPDSNADPHLSDSKDVNEWESKSCCPVLSGSPELLASVGGIDPFCFDGDPHLSVVLPLRDSIRE